MRTSFAAIRSTAFFTVCLAIFFAGGTLAQSGGPSESVVGTWIVLIESEPETRTLVIDNAAPIEGGLLLAAKYNLSSRKPSPIEAKILIADGQRKLAFTTQAASIVNAVEQPDGSFIGTFTPRSGSQRAVTIRRADANTMAANPVQQDPLGAVKPNPSLNRSTNGGPPGPVWRYAVHFRQPGPGVPPSAPG
jgi:hypothetical protein